MARKLILPAVLLSLVVLALAVFFSCRRPSPLEPKGQIIQRLQAHDVGEWAWIEEHPDQSKWIVIAGRTRLPYAGERWAITTAAFPIPNLPELDPADLPAAVRWDAANNLAGIWRLADGVQVWP